MDITLDRFVETYSRRVARQTVTFKAEDVTNVKDAIPSFWLEESLVDITFEKQPSITVSRSELAEKLVEIKESK